MDVFKYLEDDNSSIVQHLTDTAKNYSVWTRDRVFEEAKKGFASAHQHFASEAIVENNLKNASAIERVMKEAAALKKEITSELEQIVELHVDEPGFEQSLETIAQKYTVYAELCKEQYYPALKKVISPEDAQRISDQLEQKVLS